MVWSGNAGQSFMTSLFRFPRELTNGNMNPSQQSSIRLHLMHPQMLKAVGREQFRASWSKYSLEMLSKTIGNNYA
jgi:hypothetical protein